MKTLVPAILVVLGLPKNQGIAPLIVRVTSIVDAMDANTTTYPSPSPALTLVQGHLATLTGAETALKNRLGTKAARDDARNVVIVDAHQLHTYVQSVVNQNPAQAETIAQRASMTLRKVGAKQKSDLAIKHVISGTVHDWQYSTDGGKTWTDAPSTTKSSTTITGLQPGAFVTCRQRVLTVQGRSDWSQPVTAVVS
jgi:hypothetical protein